MARFYFKPPVNEDIQEVLVRNILDFGQPEPWFTATAVDAGLAKPGLKIEAEVLDVLAPGGGMIDGIPGFDSAMQDMFQF